MRPTRPKNLTNCSKIAIRPAMPTRFSRSVCLQSRHLPSSSPSTSSSICSSMSPSNFGLDVRGCDIAIQRTNSRNFAASFRWACICLEISLPPWRDPPCAALPLPFFTTPLLCFPLPPVLIPQIDSKACRSDRIDGRTDAAIFTLQAPEDKRPCAVLPNQELFPGGYPDVGIQLPMFNETFVCQIVIDACCRMEWPRARLWIQVPRRLHCTMHGAASSENSIFTFCVFERAPDRLHARYRSFTSHRITVGMHRQATPPAPPTGHGAREGQPPRVNSANGMPELGQSGDPDCPLLR